MQLQSNGLASAYMLRKRSLNKLCKVCGYAVSKTLPAAHTYVSYPYEARCTYPAYNLNVCRACGKAYFYEDVPGSLSLGHDFSVQQPDKTVVDGVISTTYHVYKCTRCDSTVETKASDPIIILSGSSSGTLIPQQTPPPEYPGIIVQSVPVKLYLSYYPPPTCTEGGWADPLRSGTLSYYSPIGHQWVVSTTPNFTYYDYFHAQAYCQYNQTCSDCGQQSTTNLPDWDHVHKSHSTWLWYYLCYICGVRY